MCWTVNMLLGLILGTHIAVEMKAFLKVGHSVERLVCLTAVLKEPNMAASMVQV